MASLATWQRKVGGLAAWLKHDYSKHVFRFENATSSETLVCVFLIERRQEKRRMLRNPASSQRRVSIISKFDDRHYGAM